jgi:hypothetical protein
MKSLIYSLLLSFGPLMRADVVTTSLSDRAVSEESMRIAMEIKAANDFAGTSSDLHEVGKRYSAAAGDLKRFRTEFPGYRPQDKEIGIRDVEERLQIINWALEGSPNLDDGAALNSAADHLHMMFQTAESEELSGKYRVANRGFQDCLRGWLELQEMYPKWQRNEVWREIQACSKKVPVPPPQHYRYEDKKLGTPLSV